MPCGRRHTKALSQEVLYHSLLHTYLLYKLRTFPQPERLDDFSGRVSDGLLLRLVSVNSIFYRHFSHRGMSHLSHVPADRAILSRRALLHRFAFVRVTTSGKSLASQRWHADLMVVKDGSLVPHNALFRRCMIPSAQEASGQTSKFLHYGRDVDTLHLQAPTHFSLGINLLYHHVCISCGDRYIAVRQTVVWLSCSVT